MSQGIPSDRVSTRPFGADGPQVSIVGMGGMMLWGMTPEHARDLVAEAIERGVNYFDVAPTYGDAETKLGPALEPFRDRVFVACKTTERTAAGSRIELTQSLANLRTDHIDLYQLHALTDVRKDVDAAFATGGAMETFVEAKRQGRVRRIGFSAHSVEAALAALERFDFDSVMFPVNFATFEADFGPQVLEAARRHGAARIAIKALATHRWDKDDPRKGDFPYCWYKPLTDPKTATLALRWTLSQDVTTTLPAADERLFRLAMDAACEFAPVQPPETEELRALAATFEPLWSGPASL